jgi:hypothetical protein
LDTKNWFFSKRKSLAQYPLLPKSR